MKYYAVAKGRKPGIYYTWAAVLEQVDKFPGAIHQSFRTKKETYQFLKANGVILPEMLKENNIDDEEGMALW